MKSELNLIVKNWHKNIDVKKICHKTFHVNYGVEIDENYVVINDVNYDAKIDVNFGVKIDVNFGVKNDVNYGVKIGVKHYRKNIGENNWRKKFWLKNLR